MSKDVIYKSPWLSRRESAWDKGRTSHWDNGAADDAEVYSLCHDGVTDWFDIPDDATQIRLVVRKRARAQTYPGIVRRVWRGRWPFVEVSATDVRGLQGFDITRGSKGSKSALKWLDRGKIVHIELETR